MCGVGLLCVLGTLGLIGGKFVKGLPANGRLVSTKDTGLENGRGCVAPANGMESWRSAL